MKNNTVSIACNTRLCAHIAALQERLGLRHRSELFSLALFTLSNFLKQDAQQSQDLFDLLASIRELAPDAPDFYEFCGIKPPSLPHPARKEGGSAERAQKRTSPPSAEDESARSGLSAGLPLEPSAVYLLLPGESASGKRLRNIARFTYDLHAFVGWRVLICRGGKRFQRYFSDIQYGGKAAALSAALVMRAKVYEALTLWPQDPQRAFDSVPDTRQRGNDSLFPRGLNPARSHSPRRKS